MDATGPKIPLYSDVRTQVLPDTKDMSNSAPTTVRRNSREAREVFETATRCVAHTMHNGFVAVDCDVEWARDRMQFRSSTMRRTATGRYTVRVHGNEWYEVMVP